ncbi:Alpha/Beta hydrolase protein [Umbelopsis sp. AD052]|nr:Alpha/Beta hydrolase protein [Umbelopsis sp. AD052]
MLGSTAKTATQRVGSLLILQQQRTFATQQNHIVKVDYSKFPSESTSQANPPIVICHGLFGSKQNWKSLARAFSKRLSADVYTLDMRNHGDSPHNPVHNYNVMADDVATFLQTNGLENSVLMGHSMGGKVVMNLCLRRLQPVEKLVVVDMAPAVKRLSSDFASYIEYMDEIQRAKLTKRSEADAILKKVEPDLSIRQFLLTNLKKDEDTGIYKFRIPYKTLGESLDNMTAFMDHKMEPYDGSTLFIAGGKSNYIKPERDGGHIREQFPNSEIKVIEGAGHWVHAEKPEEFVNIVSDYYKQS